VVAVVFALILAAGLWHLGPWTSASGANLAESQRKWVITLAAAGLTFAIGMRLRHRTVPSFLAWLGLVSYSVYLLHPVLLGIYWHIGWSHQPHAFAIQVVITIVFLAVLLGCCWGTFRFIEMPAQRLGKRVAARIEARFGPDHAAAPAAVRSPAAI
jgi:peptidoglycan/LPS O-acetylase OafA/YrhL